MTAPTPARHHYISTACQHGLCDNRCRRTCKYCDTPCTHECHTGTPTGPLPPPWVDQARDIARELLDAIQDFEDFDHRQVVTPAQWERIRTDPALFWLRGEEAPPGIWAPPEEGP
jgi:hypothetical protein